MRNRITNAVAMVAILAALLPGTASAATAPSSEREQLLAQAEKREERVSSLLRGKTSGPQWIELNRQKRGLQELIERLRAGQPVEPADVERLLDASPR